MAKWDGLLKKKTAYMIIGIAIICFILTPILGALLDKGTVYQAKPEIVHEESSSHFTRAFRHPVTLAKDQKLIVEISEFYPNCSITIRILAKSIYDAAMIDNSTPPSGQQFLYSRFGWVKDLYNPLDPNSANSLTLSSTNPYYYIEFMGGVTSNTLLSYPGDYAVVVYGTNSGGPTDINVSFDIKIALDGPGELLANLFILIGSFLLIFYFIAAIIVILRKNYFR